MKRSYIKRNKPLSSKSRIGRRNGKRRTPALRYYDSIKADRNSWKNSMPQLCMGCRKKQCRPLEVHEICRRSHAHNNWGHRFNYLLLGKPCHEGPFDSLLQRPHAYQLALKLRFDAANFRLKEWLEMRDADAMEYVTMEEIKRCMENF